MRTWSHASSPSPHAGLPHQKSLWVAPRGHCAAELLAASGRTECAALVLVCAEAAPGSAAVGEEIARFSQRSFVRVSELVGPGEEDRVRADAFRLGPTAILDRAEVELLEVAASDDGSATKDR